MNRFGSTNATLVMIVDSSGINYFLIVIAGPYLSNFFGAKNSCQLHSVFDCFIRSYIPLLLGRISGLLQCCVVVGQKLGVKGESDQQ